MDLSLPRGIRDIEPEEYAVHERIRQAFYDVARLYNFKTMEPATLEHLSTLSAKSGADIANEIYAFKDKAGRELGLRFDLTVGITRYVSSRRDLKPPVKLACYAGAWRYEEPQHGRYRWFHQWDIEIFGAGGVEADAEVMDAGYSILRRAGVRNFVLRIGDRQVVEEFIRKSLGVTSEEKLVELMRALDKVEKKTEAELLQEYTAKGFDQTSLKSLLDFGRLRGDPEKVISRLRELHLESAESIEMAVDSLRARGLADIECNLSIVRGIDYYTSLVFEAVDRERPDLGALCGGGRYDALAAVFGRPDLPATGVAGGVERIAMSLSKEGQVKRPLAYVVYAEEGLRKEALRILGQLRGSGISADAPVQFKSLGKQLENASDLGAQWAVIVGKKELQSGKLTLKDLGAHTEEKLPMEAIEKKLSR